MGNRFSRDLIKGRIAETIFERMFVESGNFIVVPFGYEKTVNFLTQVNINKGKEKEALETVQNMPDYILINKRSEDIFLVEVKYRREKNYENIRKGANKITRKGWEKVWYFLATPEGFYFSRCADLIKDPRSIDDNKLSESKVAKKKQESYLEMLKEFEKV